MYNLYNTTHENGVEKFDEPYIIEGQPYQFEVAIEVDEHITLHDGMQDEYEIVYNAFLPNWYTHWGPDDGVVDAYMEHIGQDDPLHIDIVALNAGLVVPCPLVQGKVVNLMVIANELTALWGIKATTDDAEKLIERISGYFKGDWSYLYVTVSLIGAEHYSESAGGCESHWFNVDKQATEVLLHDLCTEVIHSYERKGNTRQNVLDLRPLI
jgi:hypothetical protein